MTEKIAVVTVCAVLASGGPSSAGQEKLAVTTSVGREAFVKGYVWVNGRCELKQPPPIFIDRPPRHGTLCSVIRLSRTEPSVVGGAKRCAGQLVNAPQIVYLPRGNYVGPDDMHYVVKFPTADYGVEVTVTIQPADPTRPATVPRDISDPLNGKLQVPGLLMSCSALVS